MDLSTPEPTDVVPSESTDSPSTLETVRSSTSWPPLFNTFYDDWTSFDNAIKSAVAQHHPIRKRSSITFEVYNRTVSKGRHDRAPVTDFYSKTYKCAHGIPFRSRSQGKRQRTHHRDLGCPFHIYACAQQHGESYRVKVRAHEHHNHAIGPGVGLEKCIQPSEDKVDEMEEDNTDVSPNVQVDKFEKDTTIEGLRKKIDHFAKERDWDQFHTPRNLLLAMNGEVGELSECFQWKGDDHPPSEWSDAEREHLGEELSDVMIYLIRLADKCDVDLPSAVHDKMVKNARKYPADKVRGSSKKYNEYDTLV